MRDRVAAALMFLAVSVCGWLAYRFGLWSFAAASVPLAFGAAYAVVAVGILHSRPWARWLGIGLAISGAGSFPLVLPHIGVHLNPDVTWTAVVFHLSAACLLVRRDDTPWQTRTSWVLAGAPLLPLLFTGIDAFLVTRLAGKAPAIALVAIPLALAGTVALARSRTAGLLAVSLGGLLLFFARPTPPARDSVVMLMTTSMIQLTALVLVAVIVPFAVPIARWLRADHKTTSSIDSRVT